MRKRHGLARVEECATASNFPGLFIRSQGVIEKLEQNAAESHGIETYFI